MKLSNCFGTFWQIFSSTALTQTLVVGKNKKKSTFPSFKTRQDYCVHIRKIKLLLWKLKYTLFISLSFVKIISNELERKVRFVNQYLFVLCSPNSNIQKHLFPWGKRLYMNMAKYVVREKLFSESNIDFCLRFIARTTDTQCRHKSKKS